MKVLGILYPTFPDVDIFCKQDIFNTGKRYKPVGYIDIIIFFVYLFIFGAGFWIEALSISAPRCQ